MAAPSPHQDASAIAEDSIGGAEGRAVMALYAQRLAQGREDVQAKPGFNRMAFPLRSPAHAATTTRSEQTLREELERDLHFVPSAWQSSDSMLVADGEEVEATAVDSDGEILVLCHRCRLPLGKRVYTDGRKKSRPVHGECRAQDLLRELRAKDECRLQSQDSVKKARHEEFDIGWKPGSIPRNAKPAQELACGFTPRGMCCLMLQEDYTVQVVPTIEPSCAINLEYLSIALQVRRREGTEPLFSLDPIDAESSAERSAERSAESSAGHAEDAMQVKRFEPEWLAGTSVGEVMFQADYHLKELSMGAYQQPVLGMKSCMEVGDDTVPEKWSGREWFVVRKAEMQISEDGVLAPALTLGVEAREQLRGPRGLEDAPVTRPGHPLVRYAESFTRNFDLIAERRGVICQLREVAKASIMAKYLLESGIRLGEQWFNLALEESPTCCMEVPQLWNDRCFSQLSVKDGELTSSVKGRKGLSQLTFGLYGGVDFGIDRFRFAAAAMGGGSRSAGGPPFAGSRGATSVFAARTALGVRPSSSLMATSAQGFVLSPARQFARLSGVGGPLGGLSLSAASPGRLAGPLGTFALSAQLRAASLTAPPQGVDLNLDKFNLSEPTQVVAQALAGHANVAIGRAFWEALDGHATCPVLSEEDRSLFGKVFDPFLSDRRAEGDAFAPPPTQHAYVERLRRLVREEEALRRQRREHFAGTTFSLQDAGPLFPSTWTASLSLQASSELLGGLLRTRLVPRPEYESLGGVLSTLLPTSVPLFDKHTEDGTRFRIYRLGSLEVRTTQEHGAEEVLVAVFSISQLSPQPVAGGRGHGVADGDAVAKVTEFVERPSEVRGSRQSYIVLNTGRGDSIVTERLMCGTAAWQENPLDLELRNSLAKVVRSSVCSTTVGALKQFQVAHDGACRGGRGGGGAAVLCPRSLRKRFAQLAFGRAAGDAAPADGRASGDSGASGASGFMRPSGMASGRLRLQAAPPRTVCI